MKKIFTIVLSVASLSLSAQTKLGVKATEMRDPSAYAPAVMETRAGGAGVSTLALSGYYTEGFESTTFPPTGWRVENIAGPTYTWARSTAQAHLSTASAFMRYDAVAGGGQDWLILPRFTVAGTDSIVFWMRLAFAGYQPDSLCLKLSLTDSLSTSFGNQTLLKLREGTDYPPNSTTWYRYAVSLSAFAGQSVILAFKHYNVDGDGLYIDDIAVGTKPANEIAAVSTTLPSNAGVGASVVPQASFVNNGTATNTFNVTAMASPGGYTSTQTITALASGVITPATFAAWVPATPGTYTFKIFSELPGDANTINDTITKQVSVLSSFMNSGWSGQTALPAGRWATAPAFAQPCVSGTDTGFVYLISGGDAAFANSTLNSAYNITTGTWANKAPIPAARTQITPLQIKNKIYVIGGYSGSFSPVTTNSIYDIVTDTWTTGTAMPTAVGDYASGIYNDSLIYIIGGYTGSGDVNTVQVYNINTNAWTTATAKIGAAVAGGRASITGNKIVHAGGYSQTLALTIDDAQMGTIDPGNPMNITWTAIADYPAGPSGRLGAGVLPEANNLVYFAGGDPNGAGTTVINNVYAYNTLAGQWEVGPPMPVGVSNISGLAGTIKQDTLYLVTMGGYNGVSVVTSNTWLKIGPATIPTVSADAAICIGASAMLTANNGTTYSWSPAGTLDNATIATPTATPVSTTTYTVDISRKYGCPVPKTVTVTVNPLPVADAGVPASVCAGSSTSLTATGGTGYAWLPSAGLDLDNIATPVATPVSTTDYTVTVTDVNGCTNSASVLISVNTLPSADAGSGAAICEGDSIVLSASGGISFEWTPTASVNYDTAASPTATPAATTTYTVSVTDGNGCVNSDTTTITVNSLPLGLSSYSNITCNGLTDGSAGISAVGSSTYSYLWSTTETTNSISGLDTGYYSVTLTDDVTGCSISTGFTIIEPAALVVTTLDDTTNSCDGVVMAMVSGGTFSFNYLWTPGGSTADTAMNLCPGTYTVMVTDANGCTSTATANVLSSVSVTEEVATAFDTYPNPAKENLMIRANFSTSTSIVLMDMLGKKIMDIADNANGNYNGTINITALQPGIYFLQLQNTNGISTRKVVKQ